MAKNTPAFSSQIKATASSVSQSVKRVVDWMQKFPLASFQILENLEVDFIVLGDGEYPFLHLLECLRSQKNYHTIPGIGFKKDGEIIINKNLHDVSKLDDLYISKDFGWNLVKEHINYRQIPYFINLYTSRGCKYNCAFCYLKDIRQLKTKYPNKFGY